MCEVYLPYIHSLCLFVPLPDFGDNVVIISLSSCDVYLRLFRVGKCDSVS